MGLDPALFFEAIEGGTLDLPLIRAVRARLLQGAQSHGEKDMSATYLTRAPRAPR